MTLSSGSDLTLADVILAVYAVNMCYENTTGFVIIVPVTFQGQNRGRTEF